MRDRRMRLYHRGAFRRAQVTAQIAQLARAEDSSDRSLEFRFGLGAPSDEPLLRFSGLPLSFGKKSCRKCQHCNDHDSGNNDPLQGHRIHGYALMLIDRLTACLYGTRGLRQVKVAATEQSHETDKNQIDRDDIVQQSRHHKDQDARDQ